MVVLKVACCDIRPAAGGFRGARARGPDGTYDSTFSRTVWRLYGGAKGLVMWY
jgi:hypothetical protein